MDSTSQYALEVFEPKNGKADPVRVVFEHWQHEHGHEAAKLDPKRKSRIGSRLRDGFSVEQLCEAISNAKNDPFLMGSNGRTYDGIETLLRDVAQVERLIALKAPLRERGRTAAPAVQRGSNEYFDLDAKIKADEGFFDDPSEVAE